MHSLKLGCTSEKCEQTCFFIRFALFLHEESSWTVCRLLHMWSMRKVRATQSIPLVNVQGVGDGRVDAEENNRPVQAR